MARANPKKTIHKGRDAHKTPPKPSAKKPTKSGAVRLGPADLSWIPGRLRSLYREAYPRFSEAEMQRRRHEIERIMEAAKIEHLLICGMSRSGSAVSWLTGWPVTAEAIGVLSPGLPIGLPRGSLRRLDRWPGPGAIDRARIPARQCDSH